MRGLLRACFVIGVASCTLILCTLTKEDVSVDGVAMTRYSVAYSKKFFCSDF